MTIEEKRKYVTGNCADMKGCDSCPCFGTGTCCNGAILVLYDEKGLNVMIDAFQKATTPDKEVDKDFDTVERPQHYTSTSIECIDAMIETQGVVPVFHFCICNAFKYLWRHSKKNGFEDLKKAAWYLNKAIELKEKCDE